MNMAEVMEYKYGPDGWTAQDDGDGPYIKTWTRAEDKPTTDDLSAWAAEMDAAKAKQSSRVAIVSQLAGLDAAAVRPLRAVAAGTATDADKAKLDELEAQAQALRAQLAALG